MPGDLLLPGPSRIGDPFWFCNAHSHTYPGRRGWTGDRFQKLDWGWDGRAAGIVDYMWQVVVRQCGEIELC